MILAGLRSGLHSRYFGIAIGGIVTLEVLFL